MPHCGYFPTVIRRWGVTFSALLALGLFGCDRSEPTSQVAEQALALPRFDPDTLRIACRIDDLEIDYRYEGPRQTPLSVQMGKRSPERSWWWSLTTNATGVATSRLEAGTTPQALVGYVQKYSVARGEPVELYYAAELVWLGEELASAEVFDADDNTSIRLLEFGSGERPLAHETCESWYSGCEFSASLVIDSAEFSSGTYYVFLTDDAGAQSLPVYFHIRPTVQEVADADVVVLGSELTWWAYNFYGGGSLYGIHNLGDDGEVRTVQNEGSRLYVSSTRKPLLTDPSGLRPDFSTSDDVARFFVDPTHKNLGSLQVGDHSTVDRIRTSPESQLVFSRLLTEAGYNVVSIAQTDLVSDPNLLDRAKLVLITGHNEYWTVDMIEAFTDYVRNGGRVANFSANVMWWRIAYVDGRIYQDQIGHERSAGCYNHLPSPFRGTGLYPSLSGYIPDELFGVNFRFANFPVSYATGLNTEDLRSTYGLDAADLPLEEGRSIVIRAPDHPIFAGLDFREGQSVGGGTEVLAVELDGVPLTAEGGLDRRYPNRFPMELQILATAKAFVANFLWSEDASERYDGLRDVGLVVEASPCFDYYCWDLVGRQDGARVISFGSIGYAFALAEQDATFEHILLNTIEYLNNDR